MTVAAAAAAAAAPSTSSASPSPPEPSLPTRLWIGGTSGLARTYFHAFPEERWLVTGRASLPPNWLAVRHRHVYVAVDLTEPEQPLPAALLGATIEHIVVGIRPPLACLRSYSVSRTYNDRLTTGLGRFLKRLLAAQRPHVPTTLLHVSSVAAVNHAVAQVEWSEATDAPAAAVEALTYPYDIFKRDCEVLSQRLAQEFGVPRHTSLRLGAIFADGPGCLQCGALHLQSLGIACAVPLAIDCNSARNVARCLHAMLTGQERAQQRPQPLAPVYYYTRGTPQPVPYEAHLRDYLAVFHPDRRVLWLPHWVAQAVTWLFHLLAALLSPLQALDYLLLVASQTHSFDNRRVRARFNFAEESVADCFARRRRLLAAGEARRGKEE